MTGIKSDLPAWRIDELGRIVRRYADDVSGILGGSPYVDLGLAERAEAERAAAASLTSLPRSLAAAISPMLAGALFAAALSAWPLVICGGLKIAYDLLLLMQFWHLKPPEER